MKKFNNLILSVMCNVLLMTVKKTLVKLFDNYYE